MVEGHNTKSKDNRGYVYIDRYTSRKSKLTSFDMCGLQVCACSDISVRMKPYGDGLSLRLHAPGRTSAGLTSHFDPGAIKD
jgi:hypothetical protein